jgi:hypothetical protein
MPSPKEEPKPRKVIDVTEPGKSEPSATSRPIIVSNRPMLQQDPMVVVSSTPSDKNDIDNTPAGEVKPPDGDLMTFQEGTKVTPPSAPNLPKDDVKSDKSPEPVKEDQTEKTEAEKSDETDLKSTEPETETIAEDEDQKLASETTETLPKPNESKETLPESEAKEPESETESEKPATASRDDQPAPEKGMKEAAKKAAEENAAKVAEQEKIIDSKKYYLPINSVEHRKDIRRAALLLILVILFALIWLDIVLDAGILKLGHIHSLTHFFNT